MSSNGKVTRKDVAEYAGVSETIVSYVLNDNRYVSEEKRRRVLEAVRVLKYHPNNIARALRGKPSGHILFIADHIANEHFGLLVSKMAESAYEKGYLISLMDIHHSDDFVSRIISRQPDGVVISSTVFPAEKIRELADFNIPVVLLGSRDYEDMDPRVSVIYTGLDEGARKAVRLLAEKGRKHIVQLDRISTRGHFGNMQDLRYRGFCEQIKQSGMEFNAHSVITGCNSEDALMQAIVDRIRSGIPMDGIVARNDAYAAIAVTAIHSCGLSVPEDISVIGFDNTRISQITSPKLTTIEIDRRSIADAIFSTLEAMIHGGEAVRMRFDTILVEREST